jgi:hypothetical protein
MPGYCRCWSVVVQEYFVLHTVQPGNWRNRLRKRMMLYQETRHVCGRHHERPTYGCSMRGGTLYNMLR